MGQIKKKLKIKKAIELVSFSLVAFSLRSCLFTPPFLLACWRHVAAPLPSNDVAFQLSQTDVDTRMWIHCEIFTGFHATDVANRQKWNCTGKICPSDTLEVRHQYLHLQRGVVEPLCGSVLASATASMQ